MHSYTTRAFSVLSTLLVISFFVTPFSASARTEAEIRAELAAVEQVITTKQQERKTLLTELTQVLAGGGDTTPPATGTLPKAVCTELKVNIPGVSVSKADIQKLQAFLMVQGDMSAGVQTGVYDSATTLAVQRFQARTGIVFSGTPDTTGYGAVGPSTRGKIRDLSCQTSTTSTLKVTAPNGGATYRQNTDVAITWTGAGTGKVSIQLLKGRSVSRTIASNVDASLGTYTWKVPKELPSADDYGVRITKSGTPVVTDESDANFSVRGKVTVTSPNTAVVLAPGSTTQIMWTIEGSLKYTQSYDEVGSEVTLPPTVTIQLLKAGAVVSTIASNVSAQTGSYSWKIPAGQAIGGDYKVRITDAADKTATDDSDSAFSFGFAEDNTTAPKIDAVTVTDETSGAISVGDKVKVAWTLQNIKNVKVSLYKGTTLIRDLSASATTAGGFLSVALPTTATAGTDYKVRVTSTTNTSIFKESAAFEIKAQSVKVTAPNGGASYEPGKPLEIKWERDGSVANVKIVLVKGTVETLISASRPASDGAFTWTIPTGQTLGTDYKIRVQNTANTAMSDDSDAVFTIGYANTATAITVTKPTDASVTVAPGTSLSVQWTTVGTIANVKITLLKGDAEVKTLIASTKASTGAYVWNIPADQTVGSDYKIRVADAQSGSTLKDESDNVFSIAYGANGPQVSAVTAALPTGDTLYNPGDNVAITWTAQNLTKPVALYAVEAGGAKTTIIASVTGTTRSWTIPTTLPAGSYKIRVEGTQNPTSLFAESVAFSVAQHVVVDATSATNAVEHRGAIGHKFHYRCPSGSGSSDSLWGVNTYKDDSSVCAAAVHMGAITNNAGGVVVVTMQAGANSYTGSTKNGIISKAFATKGDGSFTVAKSTLTLEGASFVASAFSAFQSALWGIFQILR